MGDFHFHQSYIITTYLNFYSNLTFRLFFQLKPRHKIKRNSVTESLILVVFFNFVLSHQSRCLSYELFQRQIVTG